MATSFCFVTRSDFEKNTRVLLTTFVAVIDDGNFMKWINEGFWNSWLSFKNYTCLFIE